MTETPNPLDQDDLTETPDDVDSHISVEHLSGKQFFSRLLENWEQFLQVGGWLTACQSGTIRSVQLHNFLKDQGFPTVTPPQSETDRQPRGGMKVHDIPSALLTKGFEVTDQGLKIRDFEAAFDHVVIFSTNETSKVTESFVDKIKRTLKLYINKDSKFKLKIFIVNQDEMGVYQILDIINDNQTEIVDKAEIIKKINSDHRIR